MSDICLSCGQRVSRLKQPYILLSTGSETYREVVLITRSDSFYSDLTKHGEKHGREFAEWLHDNVAWRFCEGIKEYMKEED